MKNINNTVDFSLADVAAELGTSHQNVQQTLARATAKASAVMAGRRSEVLELLADIDRARSLDREIYN